MKNRPIKAQKMIEKLIFIDYIDSIKDKWYSISEIINMSDVSSPVIYGLKNDIEKYYISLKKLKEYNKKLKKLFSKLW